MVFSFGIEKHILCVSLMIGEQLNYKAKLVLLFLASVFAPTAHSTDILWETVANPQNVFFDVTESTQGGFAASGRIDDQACIFTIDQVGNPQWSVVPYPQPDGSSQFAAIDEIPGGYVACGHAINQTGEMNILISCVDYNGNILWNREIDSADFYDRANDLVCTSSGETYVACYSYDGGPQSEALVLKLSSDGDVIWSRSWGEDSEAVSIQLNSAGEVAVLADGSNDVSLLIYNPEGELLWNRAYPNLGGITLTSDSGGYCISGGGFSLYRIDLTGEPVWEYSYEFGPPTVASNLRNCTSTRDGGYITCGFTITIQESDILDGYICKISPVGELEWSSRIEREGCAVLESVVQVSDGGYLAAGWLSDARGWFVRFAPETGIEHQEHAGENVFAVNHPWPNPFRSLLVLSVEVFDPTDISISIYDVNGRVVDEIFKRDCQQGLLDIEWQPDVGTAAGTYIISVEAGNDRQILRVVYLK